MIPEAAWTLIPDSLPVDIEPWERIAISETDLNERQRRSFLWAHSVLRSIRVEDIMQGLDNYLQPRRIRIADISAGFIPIGEGDERRSFFERTLKLGSASPGIFVFDGAFPWAFGVVIGVEPAYSGAPIAGLLQFSRMISGFGITFPVITEWRDIVLHKPADPSGATSAWLCPYAEWQTIL
jgi:hypothetical protein